MAKGSGLVYKCGLKRTVLYGCKRLGMPSHQLRRRRAAGKILAGSQGARSLTLQLAVAKEDPAYDATEAPLVRWARACLGTGGGPRDRPEQMQHAWRRQQVSVGMRPQWGRVKGPAGAVIMSMRRLDGRGRPGTRSERGRSSYWT